MGRHVRRGIFFALLAAFAAPAPAADPLLMLLLGAAREMITASIRSHLAEPAAPDPVPSASAYRGTPVEPEHVRWLIDEGFGYLSEAQRQEIFDSLHAALSDPRNAAVRGPMIEYFAQKAIAVREAQARLSRLSQSEKELLAVDFRKSIASLPEDEQLQVVRLLRKRLLPVPEDLNELLLGALQD